MKPIRGQAVVFRGLPRNKMTIPMKRIILLLLSLAAARADEVDDCIRARLAARHLPGRAVDWSFALTPEGKVAALEPQR
jgi:hypothetical protein